MIKLNSVQKRIIFIVVPINGIFLMLKDKFLPDYAFISSYNRVQKLCSVICGMIKLIMETLKTIIKYCCVTYHGESWKIWSDIPENCFLFELDGQNIFRQKVIKFNFKNIQNFPLHLVWIRKYHELKTIFEYLFCDHISLSATYY